MFVFDLVHDAVVTGADPPLARATNALGCGWGSRFFREQLKNGLDAAAYLGSNLGSCRAAGGAKVTLYVMPGQDQP